MAKRRKRNRENAEKAPDETMPEIPPALSAPAPRRRFGSIAIFSAGFAAAFLLAWLLFSPGRTPPPAPVATETPSRTLAPADLAEFLRAVEERDFPAMSRVGTDLFRTGDRIPDSVRLLEEYAVDSFPPHRVYAFFTSIGGSKSYRVLLTMEGDGIVSFMAEEVPVAG